MSQVQTSKKGITGVVAIVAIILAGLALVAPYALVPGRAPQIAPQTREFTVVSTTANFDDDAVGVPHDIFVPTQLVVNQGDKVIIHFINTEDKPENHTFTIAAYSINVDLGMLQKQDITFTATQAGVFPFTCTYHLPTMTGQLVVLATQ